MGRDLEESKKYFKTYYQKNRQKYIEHAKQWKEEKRKWFYETFKSRLICIKCGEKDIRCLDFHHRDPSKKEYKMTYLLRGGSSRKKVITELEKCDVLCANCHRKHHIKLKDFASVAERQPEVL